jgi:predicted DsbA family dithiol-disulfide isomerase
MSLIIQVYADYVCPFCFLAEFPLQAAIAGKDVQVEWMPFELRPLPHETLRPDSPYLQRAWRESVYPTAKQLGMFIVLPKISPQPYTHLALEGLQFAKEHGLGGAYSDRVMRAFFQEEQDIGQINVLTRLAGEIGLDVDEYRETLVTRRYREAHQQALRYACDEVEVTSVPTFIIGEYQIPGIASQAQLEEVIALAQALPAPPK